MAAAKSCPSCNCDWEEKETITEFFLRKGNTKEEAEKSGAMYGCTPETPRHFGKNVVGIEIMGGYDGISYWKCTECNATFDRWTMKEVDKTWELGT